jgi:hypothetical protein|tara:strand:+ start:1034 stop:3982 length:2949 start_codon:yes stop_codon:yes gene_type:complete
MSEIAKYKKQHPEYRNIPDIELAEILYEKAYKGRMNESEFYEFAFPEIAAKRGTDEIISPDDEFNENFEFKSDKPEFKPTTSEVAKSAGVSVNDPADIKSRFGGSLGYNEEQKKLAIKNSLSKIYKQDIDVREGPQTGELEYFNPKTQQYSLVDKPGMDIGDFGDIGGDALVIGSDLAVTVVGSIFTTPVGGLSLGAIAAGTAEYYRLKWGQEHYQVNLDLTDKQLLAEAFKTASISGAAGFIGIGGVKLIKGVNNIVKGRTFSDVDEGVKLAKSTKALEAEQAATSINKTLEDATVKSRLKYTLAEATDDKELLAIQSSFENVRHLGKTEEFSTFGKNQAEALNEYFKLIKQNFGGPTGSTFDTGFAIKEVLEKRNTPVIKNIVKKQEASEDLLTKKIFKLPDGSSKTTGVEFRSIINDLSKTYKSNMDLAGKELDRVTGFKTINTDEIAKAISKLSDKEIANLVKVSQVEGVFKKDVFENLANPEGVIPLSSARETISTLGKLIREKELGLAAGESVDVGRLKFLKSAFTNQVRKNAGKEYLDELQKFNDLTIAGKELLNNETITKLTVKDIGSKLKIGDEAVFETTFKKGVNNGKTAKEAFDVVSRSPEALKAYKESIFDFYKTKVLVNGKPNLSKHNAFIESYKEPLRIFFNKAEYGKISKIGGLAKNVEKTNKAFIQTNKELNKSFEGTLLNTSPQEIFKKIYGPGNVGEIRTLKNILAKNPEVYKKFQRDVLTDLNEKVFKTDKKYTLGRVLDADAFNKYLNGGGGERGYRNALKELFGKEYIKNLDILNNALQISSRSAASAQQGVLGSALTDIIRARLGQFTFAGRLFTAGRRLATAASNRMIARALLNPDSLKDLIALRKLSKKSKAYSVILAKLGGSIFMVQDDLPTQPPKEAIIEEEVPIPDISNMFEDIVSPEGTVVGSRRVSSLPTTPTTLSTPPVNAGILQVANNTTMNQDYNNLSSLEKDKLLRGIS